MPAGQPNVADLCGDWGLGGKPNMSERLAWTSIPNGNCDAVRAHLTTYPDGAYAAIASRILDHPQTETKTNWRPHREESYWPISGLNPKSTELEAKEDALRRARDDVQSICEGLTATGRYRFLESHVNVDDAAWKCEELSGTFTCSADGRRYCDFEFAIVSETQFCSGIVKLIH